MLANNVFKADEIIHLNPYDLLKNHGLIVTHTEHVQYKNELIETISVVDTSLVDIRDLQHVEGYVILHGKVFLCSKASVPFAILENPENLHIHDERPCERSLETTLFTLNRIKDSKIKQKRWILMILPEGFSVSGDFRDSAPLTVEKVYPQLRPFEQDIVYGGKKEKSRFVFRYLPLTWKFRVITNDKKVLQIEKEEEEDIFDKVTQGMKNLWG